MHLSDIRNLLLLTASIVYADDTAQLSETTPRDNSSGCNCFLVSGEDPGYFQYYRFWDFRSIANDDSNDYTIAPPLVTSSENQGGQDVTSGFLNTTQFNNDWSIQNEVENPDSPVPSVNSARNVFISRDSTSGTTFLALRVYRLPDFVSVAEVDSNQKNILHGSIRARMKLLPQVDGSSLPFVDTGISANSIDGLNSSHPVAPGAVFGLFTYHSDTQESDIEILTYDPTAHIRYSNQPDWDAEKNVPVPGASTDTVLPNDKVWTDWHDHRIDWYDGVSRWYVDGELVLSKTLNVPTEAGGIIINLWSDGDTWSGNMSEGAQIVAGIEWIEMAFNTSGEGAGANKRDGQGMCGIGCIVDGVQETGVPQVAFNVTSNESGISGRSTMTADNVVLALLSILWACIML